MRLCVHRFDFSTPEPSHWLWLLSLVARMVALPWCLLLRRCRAMEDVR